MCWFISTMAGPSPLHTDQNSFVISCWYRFKNLGTNYDSFYFHPQHAHMFNFNLKMSLVNFLVSLSCRVMEFCNGIVKSWMGRAWSFGSSHGNPAVCSLPLSPSLPAYLLWPVYPKRHRHWGRRVHWGAAAEAPFPIRKPLPIFTFRQKVPLLTAMGSTTVYFLSLSNSW